MIKENLKVATQNVKGINTKEQDFTKIFEEKFMNIAIGAETKTKGNGSKNVGNYTIFYSGEDGKMVNVYSSRSIRKKYTPTICLKDLLPKIKNHGIKR